MQSIVLRPTLRIVAAITILCVILATGGYRPTPALATTDWANSRVEASSTHSSDWSSSYLIDGDTGTRWSSERGSSANETEWVAFWFDTYHSTNYIKLYPRYYSGSALSFPVDLEIQYSDGTQWIDVWTLENFPVPSEDWIIIPLGETVTADGLRVNATQLGQDNNGNYYFQLGEVAGGYDSGFETLELLDFDASGGYNEFDGIKAGPFDPNKLSEWHYDYRMPLYESNCSTSRQNIYAPQAVWNEPMNEWYVYYGGNDEASNAGCDTAHDNIFYVPTDAEFQSFDESENLMIISEGSFRNANNPALTKSPDGQWGMVYTAGWCPASYGSSSCAAAGEENNLPAYATSSDGVNWSPSSPGDPFGANNLISVSNFHNGTWNDSTQYINNQNGLLYDHGYFWYYYGPEGLGGKDYRAYSTDMANFTETGYVMDGAMASVNDVKKFRYNGNDYYMMVAQHNDQGVYYSVTSDPTAFPVLSTLFSTTGVTEGDESIAQDNYIVSAGMVADETTLYGVLYGAAENSSLNTNKIFAKWLQKKVYFSNEDVGYGSIERADGPDTVRLGLDGSNDIQTGTITIYDTDGSTLLFTSPEVTIIGGMQWQYNGDASNCGLPRSGNWTISSDCTISDAIVAPGDVSVENGATLTVESTGALDIDLEEYTLRIQHDSRVRIRNGGKID